MGGFASVLGRRDVFALAFGAMIGWGWVVLSGDWSNRAGTVGSMAAFLLGAILVAFIGLAYAGLTSALPRAGGALGFTWRALGPHAAWIASWSLVLACAGVCAFESIALAQVVHALIPSLKFGHLYRLAGSDVYWSWILVGVVCGVALLVVNLVGIRASSLFQVVSTFGLLLIGVLFVVGSSASGSPVNLNPEWRGLDGVLSVAVMTPFFYTGFVVVPQAAEEIRIPARDIGKGSSFQLFSLQRGTYSSSGEWA